MIFQKNRLTSVRTILFFFILFLSIFYLYEKTALDLTLQNFFFDFTTMKWLVDKDDPLLKAIFYTGTKVGIACIGVIAFIIFILTFTDNFKKKYERLVVLRFKTLYIFLSLALIPLTISYMKNITNTACPYDLKLYGKNIAYVKVFDHYKESERPPYAQKCFPGGHASGGFALFCLYFVARNRKERILTLILSLGLGTIMSLYQMMKGAHFLSHNLVTIFISWLMAQIIYLVLRSLFFKKMALSFDATNEKLVDF